LRAQSHRPVSFDFVDPGVAGADHRAQCKGLAGARHADIKEAALILAALARAPPAVRDEYVRELQAFRAVERRQQYAAAQGAVTDALGGGGQWTEAAESEPAPKLDAGIMDLGAPGAVLIAAGDVGQAPDQLGGFRKAAAYPEWQHGSRARHLKPGSGVRRCRA
jgi:hypothetical protein